MPELKINNQRDEVHRAIWAVADRLRGAVDGWDFKNYVLGAMFYRYLSEYITDYINKIEHDAGDLNFNYADMSDVTAETARNELVDSLGYFIKPGELFINVTKRAASDANLNETLEQVFNNIESSAQGTPSEKSFKDLFKDFDVNSNKLGASVAKRNERLIDLLDGIAEMNLGQVQDHDIDAFGDAYEYLMTMYASRAGKSGGEFFTPSDVAELLTRLGSCGRDNINNVYDPACGSGSLLLKSKKLLGKLEFYGQEINITTYNLCRINMILHGVGFEDFNIACGDTLTEPELWDGKKFDLIVSNPPYATHWAGKDNTILINDDRYSPAGVLAPKSNADFAFIMHSLYCLDYKGTAAIVCFPGIMYRGSAEQQIRKFLINNNYIDCIIQLPANLFFGTSIATCILIMKKNRADNKILFIDASREYIKATNNNRLAAENISNIVNAFAAREDKQYFCRLVTLDEIAEQNYNLSVSTYVEQQDTREKIDIKILNAEINNIVAREQELRLEINKIIAELELD